MVAGSAPVLAASAAPSRAGSWRDLLALTRPRVTLVAALTGGPALALGRSWPSPARALAVLGGLVLLGAACSALNAWLERDRDGRMARTRGRPLPAGRLRPSAALAFGILAAAAALALLGAWGSRPAVLIALATIGVYLGPYTLWAKPHTGWSAVVGAAPGAAAPLIADAAIGGQVGPWGWALFSIVFLWQPPHVWAIELFRAGEHAAAGLPTMPGRIGEQATRRLVLAWIVALFPVSLLPSLAGPLGPAYAAVALAVGYLFARAAVVALRRRDARADRAVFLASLVYMLLLFGAMLVELGLR